MVMSKRPVFFFNEVLRIPYQQFLMFLSFMKTIFKIRKPLKSDSHLPKNIVLFASVKSPFKNDEKCSLFHLSSFCSRDI